MDEMDIDHSNETQDSHTTSQMPDRPDQVQLGFSSIYAFIDIAPTEVDSPMVEAADTLFTLSSGTRQAPPPPPPSRAQTFMLPPATVRSVSFSPAGTPRPDPRYIRLNPGPNPPPPTHPIPASALTLAAAAHLNPTGFHSRVHTANQSFTAPLLPLPPTTTEPDPHISSGEHPTHHDFTRHVGGTIKCDVCDRRSRNEVYKCQHCLSQICDTCTEEQIRVGGEFQWKGGVLHGGFRGAYTARKMEVEDLDEEGWEGWVDFEASGDGDDGEKGMEKQKWRVYVVIHVVKRENKKEKPKKKG